MHRENFGHSMPMIHVVRPSATRMSEVCLFQEVAAGHIRGIGRRDLPQEWAASVRTLSSGSRPPGTLDRNARSMRPSDGEGPRDYVVAGRDHVRHKRNQSQYYNNNVHNSIGSPQSDRSLKRAGPSIAEVHDCVSQHCESHQRATKKDCPTDHEPKRSKLTVMINCELASETDQGTGNSGDAVGLLLPWVRLLLGLVAGQSVASGQEWDRVLRNEPLKSILSEKCRPKQRRTGRSSAQRGGIYHENNVVRCSHTRIYRGFHLAGRPAGKRRGAFPSVRYGWFPVGLRGCGCSISERPHYLRPPHLSGRENSESSPHTPDLCPRVRPAVPPSKPYVGQISGRRSYVEFVRPGLGKCGHRRRPIGIRWCDMSPAR